MERETISLRTSLTVGIKMRIINSLSMIVLTALIGATALADRVIQWSGDLRYRQEVIESDTVGRSRSRIRARIKAEAEVNEKVDVTLRLATGGHGVTSTNQTLGNYGSNKPIDLDMAYFEWRPVGSLKIWAGKMKNPLYQGNSDLIFDTDWTPGGYAFNYETGRDDGFAMFINFSEISIDERANTKRDASLDGSQIGFRIPFLGTELTLGYGALRFDNIKGYDGAFINRGNSLVLDKYVNEYNLQQIFLAYDFKIKDIGVQIFVEDVNNTEVVEQSKGFLYGFKVGNAEKKGTWDLKITYRELEKDAVLGGITDGDTFGGTDGKGVVLGFNYACGDNSSLGLSFYDVKRSVSMVEIDYKKLHLNYVMKF